jgi:hypothetical protein
MMMMMMMSMDNPVIITECPHAQQLNWRLGYYRAERISSQSSSSATEFDSYSPSLNPKELRGVEAESMADYLQGPQAQSLGIRN